MLNDIVFIKNPTGLHARPAVELIKLAKKFKSKILLKNGDKEANGISIMEVMALGATKNSKIVLIIDGIDEEEPMAAIKTYITQLHE